MDRWNSLTENARRPWPQSASLPGLKVQVKMCGWSKFAKSCCDFLAVRRAKCAAHGARGGIDRLVGAPGSPWMQSELEQQQSPSLHDLLLP